MKLLDYVFSLNVTIDYNKEDQRNSTPEQRDEYDDLHRETLFFEPFAEEDNNEFRSIYIDLLNEYISKKPLMAAAMEKDFAEEELNAYVEKFEKANREDVPFYERFYDIDSMFILLVPATIEEYLKNRNRVDERNPLYQVQVQFANKLGSGLCCTFWFEIFGTNRSRVSNAIGKSCNYHYFPCERYEIMNGVGIIPDSVTEISNFAFSDCAGLTSISIPDSVTEIGDGAFKGCTGLTSIVIPDSVTKIGLRAFLRCTGLNSISIGNSVTEIGDGAFDGCTGLTSIVIPDSVTKIGDWAYSGCTELQSIVIQGKIEKIGDSAFRDCSSLKTITLPAGIKKISKIAFEGCTAIERINVPAKKADYYKKRLPENLHAFIVEQ